VRGSATVSATATMRRTTDMVVMANADVVKMVGIIRASMRPTRGDTLLGDTNDLAATPLAGIVGTLLPTRTAMTATTADLRARPIATTKAGARNGVLPVTTLRAGRRSRPRDAALLLAHPPPQRDDL
jgi:hypothetical protein